uniref:Glycosyl transferase, family 2 n=1 Tax=Solibacter usitatus (strain Ellin6076) TaxID=234267 RepID=Q01R65_SOLUE
MYLIRAEYFMQEAKVSHSPGLIRNPSVSVILPTYCRGDNGLLKRAIESVLSQTFQSFELILMDDGSTDSTAEIISSYVKVDDRVIHVRHDNNSGLWALRMNEGLLMARGEFCAYQFDDDRWTEAALATLVGELRENTNFGIAYGLCKCTLDGKEIVLGGPFNYSQLVAGNFIANNSVVNRRTVFERLGGYDMHLVMRRLADWDLWLRWGRHAAFLSLDETVSFVEAGRADSVGKTVPADLTVVRSQIGLDRTAGLRPEALKSYIIDGLDHLKHLGQSKVDAVWREQAAPYLSRFRHIWPAARPPKTRPLHVLSVKAHFDTTVDIMIGNYAEVLAADFAFTFVPQSQVDEAMIRCVDILLLYRAIDQQAEQLAEFARQHGKPVIYLMDDDLTTIHEISEEFCYLAPGTPCYLALQSLIRGADLVITYSAAVKESVEELNPRNIVLETNIRRERLAAARSGLSHHAETGRRPVMIGFAGGAARREEFAVLWQAIVEVSRQLGTNVEFEFWGFTPDGLDQLHSPYRCEPFTFSYDEYLDRLTSRGFDVMITPLFGEKRAKRGKCPIKFLEFTAAGALGVYSDVEPYRAVVDGLTGIKCENTVEAWTAALLRAASLPYSERKAMVARAIECVDREFTTEVQAPRLAAALEAAVLHGLLHRAPSGKPRVAYFCHSPYLGGAENHLLRHAALSQAFQFEPLLVLPSGVSAMVEEVQHRATALGIPIAYLPLTVETEIDVSRELDEPAIAAIMRWLRQNRISLVHSVILMREVGEASRRLGIPHAASIYATASQGRAGVFHCDVVHSDSLLYANRWSTVLDAPAQRILAHVPDEYFEAGTNAAAAPNAGGALTFGIFGTLQPRKGQLQAIEAIGLLRKQCDTVIRLRLYGYDHFFPDYLASCREMAERYGVSDRVSFPGFVTDTAKALRDVDAVICASDWDSLPQAILEAMAAGRLVIAPAVGGIPEVVSRSTGILMPDNTAVSICRALTEALRLSPGNWSAKTKFAREVVRAECSGYSVSTELFRLYRQAATEQARRTGRPAVAARELTTMTDGGASLFTPEASGALELLRTRLHEINYDMRLGE